MFSIVGLITLLLLYLRIVPLVQQNSIIPILIRPVHDHHHVINSACLISIECLELRSLAVGAALSAPSRAGLGRAKQVLAELVLAKQRPTPTRGVEPRGSSVHGAL